MALARQHFSRFPPYPRTSTRCLQCSASTRALVGPPDRVSNIRPVIYDNPAKSPNASPEGRIHPYSLEEFNGDPNDYQWRLERQRLDLYHHAFWTDVRLSLMTCESGPD